MRARRQTTHALRRPHIQPPAQVALRLRPLHEAANDNGRPFRLEVPPHVADRIVALGVGVVSILLLFAVAKGWL